MFTKILYAGAFVWLLLSFLKDREKTKTALKKAWKSFENILPSVLAVLLLIGFVLTVLDPDLISKAIGSDSGLFGLLLAAVIWVLTNVVKPTKKLHPIVYIAASAVVGIVFSFAGV